ncbi:MAG: hypothetical protein AAB877_00625, partial [Patescibacteria group bacterium]
LDNNFKSIIYYRDKAYSFEENPISENILIVDDTSGEDLNKEAAPGVEVIKVSEILEKVPEGAPLPDPYSSKDWGQDSSINLKAGNGGLEFIKNSFISFVYAFLGPFPWQLRSLKHAFVLPELILWWICLFFITKGIIKYAKNNRLMLMPLLFGVILIGIVSVYMTNFGLVTRLRMSAFVALMCLVPFGFGKFTRLNNFRLLRKLSLPGIFNWVNNIKIKRLKFLED